MLRTERVSKIFQNPVESVFGVREVDLTLATGEFVCLMGPSGCGKSTLLSLLSGLDTATTGEVVFAGRSLASLSSEGRAALRLREIGMVFQDHHLIPEFTALENVMLPLDLQGQHPPIAREAALVALERVGMADLSDRFTTELSGGQRQRVGIARAIVGEHRVVLADEATGSLDHANSQMVFRLLADLAGQGYAVMAATHDVGASSFASRTLHMVDGSLTNILESSDIGPDH